MKRALAALLLLACSRADERVVPGFEAVRSFAAPAARQAVAVDAEHFYAISNRWIEKYDRKSGAKLAEWRDPKGGPIVHLNSGAVIDGELLCAHSNYPGVPMQSSIERFDPETLERLGSRRLEDAPGSATWIDRHDGDWYVAFGNYAGRGGVPGRGPEQTTLVRYDADWRPTGRWRYPEALVARFAGRSNSGGVFAADGLLLLTGHDGAEIYRVRVPPEGGELEWVDTWSAPIDGQGIARDPVDPSALWGVVKRDRRVVEMRPAR